MADFKSGDVVVLKSGGPQMTAGVVNEDLGIVHCQWFEKNKLEGGSFQAAALRVVDAGAGDDGSCETSCETSCP